jgi:hypothetical protein
MTTPISAYDATIEPPAARTARSTLSVWPRLAAGALTA